VRCVVDCVYIALLSHSVGSTEGCYGRNCNKTKALEVLCFEHLGADHSRFQIHNRRHTSFPKNTQIVIEHTQWDLEHHVVYFTSGYCFDKYIHDFLSDLWILMCLSHFP